MTEFTPARLAELRAVAEAANAEWYSKAPTIALRRFHEATYPPTVLSLIAALEAKTAEVEGCKQRFSCDGGCSYGDGPQEECSLHGRNPRELWEAIGGLARERDEARAEVEALQAWQAQTVRRVRDTVAGEHYAMLVVEDIPNADYGELIDTLVEQRDDARAALKAKDSYVGDLEEQLQHIKSLWRATGRAEADEHRRADRAEAALERVRALHRKRRAYADDWDTCTCGYGSHPCPTILALEAGEGQ